MPFYRDLLGFRLTDYYSHPFEARFLHVNPRHHSLAFIKTGKTAVHHIMMEVFSFDDMGQGYDIALGSDQVATSLGRHTSDFITSFYSFTPSGFMVEYGWGARSIDPDTWQAFERRKARACGATIASGSRPSSRPRRASCGSQNAAQGHAPAGAGDGRQLPGHGWRLSVLGQRDADSVKVARADERRSLSLSAIRRVHSSVTRRFCASPRPSARDPRR